MADGEGTPAQSQSISFVKDEYSPGNTSGGAFVNEPEPVPAVPIHTLYKFVRQIQRKDAKKQRRKGVSLSTKEICKHIVRNDSTQGVLDLFSFCPIYLSLFSPYQVVESVSERRRRWGVDNMRL